MRNKAWWPALLAMGTLGLASALTPVSAQPAPAQLRVSDNKRFLVKGDGTPFFYLGDTAWELFHRLNREEAERYLQDRAAKGFTVIQAVVLAELDGLGDPNAYGALPLIDRDPAKPNPKYFEQVDWIVRRANALGLTIGMLPTWGDKVGNRDQWGRDNTVFTPDNAAIYGEWLGRRYQNAGLIWILGGDRNPDNPDKLAIWRAMAAGLKKGDGGRHLMTFHPTGGSTSATWFHNDSWLDFNTWQTGHGTDAPVWDQMGEDYRRTPIKPVLDSEPLYEDHPIAFDARRNGYSGAADVRRIAYLTMLAGAAGYTYGNHSMWQMNKPGKNPVNGPRNFWFDALNRPGARQMRHLRSLIESRPLLRLLPDQSLLAPTFGDDAEAPVNANAGLKRVQAARASDGSYALIYLSSSRTVQVRTDKIAGAQMRAWWFNPRNGQSTLVGNFAHPTNNLRSFTPPDEGENLDWVLVLDDAARRFPAPGHR